MDVVCFSNISATSQRHFCSSTRKATHGTHPQSGNRAKNMEQRNAFRRVQNSFAWEKLQFWNVNGTNESLVIAGVTHTRQTTSSEKWNRKSLRILLKMDCDGFGVKSDRGSEGRKPCPCRVYNRKPNEVIDSRNRKSNLWSIPRTNCAERI